MLTRRRVTQTISGSAAALGLSSGLGISALADTKEDTTSTMLEDLLDRYIDAWNSGDAKAVMPFFADSIVYEDVALGETKTAKDLESFITSSLDDFTSLRFEKVTACENEGAVCWEWRMTGERKTGETLDTPGMSITEIAEGRIIRNRDYWSTLPGRMSGE